MTTITAAAAAARMFQICGNKYSDIAYSIVNLLFTWLMGSRWYTPDFSVVTIVILSFVTSWHCCLCPGVEEGGVKFVQPDDSFSRWPLLQIDASQVLRKGSKKMKITRTCTTTDLMSDYDATAGRLRAVLISRPVIPVYLDCLKRTWLATELQQMST